MKAWLEKALREFKESHKKMGPIGPFMSKELGEHQARIWFRTNSLRSGCEEDRFVRACIQYGAISTKYYCSDCWDIGCICGGIGLSCHGCCTCLSTNPNRHKVLRDKERYVLVS